MNGLRMPLGAALAGLALCAGPLWAGGQEEATVESAVEVLRAFSALPFQGIPPALLQDARGVAIIPHTLKAGFVVGGRFGRGVVLARQADGTWGNPVFITLAGGGIGFQAGVQSTDVILVFKTAHALDRILSGRDKLTLGADVAVAAGPLGRQAETGTDGGLSAEIYSYSRSRGLFAGVSLEGAGLLVDFGANAAFYRIPGGHPAAILAWRGVPVPALAEDLKSDLARLSTPVSPPPATPPPPLAPPAPLVPIPQPPQPPPPPPPPQ